MRRESFLPLRPSAFRGRTDAPAPACATRSAVQRDGEAVHGLTVDAALSPDGEDWQEAEAGWDADAGMDSAPKRGAGRRAISKPENAPLSDAASKPPSAVPSIGLDVVRVDEWLGGGLRGDGLHEFFAGDAADLPCTLGFALILAMKAAIPANADRPPDRKGLAGRKGTVQQRPGLLWLRQEGQGVPYAPGLADMGLDPAAITILHLADERALLRAALDAVRAGATGAVLLESIGRSKLLDLTATRRLVLAAARTGTLVLIVRAQTRGGRSAAGTASSTDPPGLSAAHSRWQVRSAPSRPLLAGAPGLPVFDIALRRQRGGRDGLHILLEWNRDTGCFREWDGGERRDHAPLSGDMPALATDGECADPQGRAA
ncbi:MAG: hypothetical protein ABW048_01840 [Sphingobium sp.]